MLMDIPLELRFKFLARIMQSSPTTPPRLSYLGDPERQAKLKRELPNIHNAITLEER